MKYSLRLVWIILEGILISLLLAPVVASLLPVHIYRIMSRIFLIVVVCLLVSNRAKLGMNTFADIGLRINKRWYLLFFSGLITGILTMGAIGLYMLQSSIRFLVAVPHHLLLWKICKYIITGLVVGLIEETVFRGFLLRTILKDTGFWVAVFVTSFLYAIVHFFKPLSYPSIENLTMWTGFIHLREFFTPVVIQFHQIVPQFIGLFLVGIVLALACLYCNSLGLPVGLHMGWIVGIKTLSLLTDVKEQGSLFISGNVVENTGTWVLLVILALFFWLRLRISEKNKILELK